MGWHEILQGRELDLEAGKKIARPEGATLMLHEGTDNFRMMAAAGWLRWSIAQGGQVDVQTALARCEDLMQQQVGPKGIGFMLGEQLAGDPHFNFHAWPVLAMRQMALQLKDQGTTLLALTGTWLRWFRVIADAIRGVDHRDKRPLLWPCGMRCEGGPTSQAMDELDRTMRGVPHGKYADTDPELQATNFHCIRLALALLAAGDDLGGAVNPLDRPKLKVPVTVLRAGDRIQTWMEKPAGVGDTSAFVDGHNTSIAGMIEPCDWIDANVESGVFTFGKYWQTARPTPPAGVVTRLG